MADRSLIYLSVSSRRASWLGRRVLALAAIVAIVAVGVLIHRGCRLERISESAFDDIIWEKAQRHGVSPYLVKAVVKQESGFLPWAVGDAGEVGLMQITGQVVTDWERATGQQCRLQGLLFDPRLNIEIGTWYLARAVRDWQQYRDRDVLALAQYNAGPTRARNWAPEDPNENALERVRYPGTQEYISRVLRYREALEKGSFERERR
jgi:soluble lytic murein transglycosylase